MVGYSLFVVFWMFTSLSSFFLLLFYWFISFYCFALAAKRFITVISQRCYKLVICFLGLALLITSYKHKLATYAVLKVFITQILVMLKSCYKSVLVLEEKLLKKVEHWIIYWIREVWFLLFFAHAQCFCFSVYYSCMETIMIRNVALTGIALMEYVDSCQLLVHLYTESVCSIVFFGTHLRVCDNI